MSTSTALRPAAPRPGPPRRTGPLRDLDRAADAFASLGPNWFASVMGTGIVAVAGATLPVQWPGLREFATAVWVLAAGWLVVLAAAEIVHWARHRAAALGHARNPVMVQFYGAPPMALLTVGAGALLLGPAVIGAHAALVVDAVLWPLGTLGGLASSLAVPYLMFTRLRAAPDAAFGGWLMPVVPPMVSAATGALLIPHLPAGQPRLSLLLACYAMFGISLVASVVVITQLWQRLVRHSIGPAAMVPTLWIVLGPLGQSITAAGLLGGAARLVLPYPYGPAFQAFGLVYGVPVWGFAALWAGLAAAITVRAARAHLPFSLTWWSFTFPVGTVVTGTTSLSQHTGDGLFRWAAAGLYLVLVAAWAVVSVRTAAATWRGSLLRAPAPQVPAGAVVAAAGYVPADEVAELTPTGEGITGLPA
ncbi:MAG TPA: TDT family transporter [Streptosporangiaceae bacterium]|nr:TDT family transporter [Streptosporangiaceae bacterium]